MSIEKSIFGAVDAYIERLFIEDCMQDIIDDATSAGVPNWAISPNQGMLLQVLALATGARRILEVGTQSGYSTAWLAGALMTGGSVTTIEIDAHTADVARANLGKAGLGHRTRVITGKALDVLQDMTDNNTEPFDMIFIDADKPPYAEYLNLAIGLSRPGTLIIADNVVRGGNVLDETSEDPAVIGVRRFNEALAADSRVTATIMQQVGSKDHDGMAIAVVR